MPIALSNCKPVPYLLEIQRVAKQALAATLLTVAVMGCAAKPTLRDCRACFDVRGSSDAGGEYCASCFEIRTRDPRGDEEARRAAYAEELRYIECRRRKLEGLPEPCADNALEPPPVRLTGLALSGGGIRSATFALGALQALEMRDNFDQFDYLSAVSGGAYTAGWMQAHLGARRFFDRDVYDYEVGTDDFPDLVDNHGDHVEHLRIRSGFLNQGGWFEGGSLFWDWFWRWPFHLLLDDVLHLRGQFNFQHIIEVYEKRIRKTYFRGDAAKATGARPNADTPLTDVNDPTKPRLAPYLILNANLANAGPSRVGVDRCALDVDGPDCGNGNPFSPKPSQWSFELTRDFVGSDGTGYVETRAFARGVDAVLSDEEDRPAAVVVDGDGRDSDVVRLSTAVAVSGAAFDSAALMYQLDIPGVTELGQLVAGGLLNLYLGLDVPNFAREHGGWWSWWDYLRMFTVERVPRWLNTGARWLYVTDGGHYENLGVLSLLRRGVSCIVALDATADPSRAHGDLKTLRDRIEQDLGLHLSGNLPSDGDPGVRHRFVVTDGAGQQRAVILYLKASVEPTQPHLLPMPGFSEFRAEREIQSIERDHLASVHDLFTAIRGRLAKVGLDVPEASVENEARCRKGLENYYANGMSPTQELETEIRKVRESVIAKEVRVRDLEREQLARVPEEIELEAELDGAGLVADGAADEMERLQDEIAREWGQIRILEMKLATLRNAEVDPLTDLRPSVEDAIAAVRQAAIAQKNLGEELQKPLIRYEAAREVRIERYRRALKQYRNAAARDEDRAERIHKVLSFVNGPSRSGFPNDSTLQQWYTWERFDAYRTLGYQTASTFIERFDENAGLDWCNFASLPADGDQPIATGSRADGGS